MTAIEPQTGHFLYRSQGEAEDVVLWHQFMYYVRGSSIVPDVVFDEMVRELYARWELNGYRVGSDRVEDYPAYIVQSRRPNFIERLTRDRILTERYWNQLSA